MYLIVIGGNEYIKGQEVGQVEIIFFITSLSLVLLYLIRLFYFLYIFLMLYSGLRKYSNPITFFPPHFVLLLPLTTLNYFSH